MCLKFKKGGTLFLRKDLSRYCNIWYAYLCAKLVPSEHVSEVIKEKVPLLYAILKDFVIDVGAIINFSIRHFLRGPILGRLPHPSLI